MSHKSRLKLLLILVGALAFMALFFFDILTIDFPRFKGSDPSDGTAVRSGTPPAWQSDQPPSVLPSTRPAVKGDGGGPASTGGQAAAPKATPLAPQPAGKAPAIDDGGQRDAFKAELAKFDEKYLSRVNSQEFKTWNQDAQQAILTGREGATTVFANADYGAALKNLREADARADKELAAYDAAYENEYKSAKAFLEADDYEAASWRIDEALRLKPDSPDAKDLKVRIDRLPEILKLVEAAAIARVENNFKAEAKHLNELLKIDPTRSVQKARLAQVETELTEQAYAGHIRRGLEYFETRNLDSARKQLSAAQGLFKQRKETDYLSNRIAALAKELKVEKLIADARAAARSDDWVRTEKSYTEVANLIPDNQEVMEGQRLARRIIELGSGMSAHLVAPERLSSLNVARIVENLLHDAKEPSAFSPSLARKRKQLSQVLDDYSQPVTIRVISDGETVVSVRGVGRIGKTQQKTIELRPGKYVFQGERTGFKSKLVEITIAPLAIFSKVEVICDEPI